MQHIQVYEYDLVHCCEFNVEIHVMRLYISLEDQLNVMQVTEITYVLKKKENSKRIYINTYTSLSSLHILHSSRFQKYIYYLPANCVSIFSFYLTIFFNVSYSVAYFYHFIFRFVNAQDAPRTDQLLSRGAVCSFFQFKDEKNKGG